MNNPAINLFVNTYGITRSEGTYYIIGGGAPIAWMLQLPDPIHIPNDIELLKLVLEVLPQCKSTFVFRGYAFWNEGMQAYITPPKKSTPHKIAHNDILSIFDDEYGYESSEENFCAVNETVDCQRKETTVEDV